MAPPAPLETLQGTLDLLVLRALAWGPMHGYAVARFIRDGSGGTLQVLDGALYTSLHRMEERGWIDAEWGLSDKGKRAKFYRLTAAGRDPQYMASLCGEQGPRHLHGDMEMVTDTFRRFAEDRIRPIAEHVHRTNGDIPEDIIGGIAELGAFGLSVARSWALMPSTAAEWKFSSAAANDIWDHTGRSCSARARTTPK